MWKKDFDLWVEILSKKAIFDSTREYRYVLVRRWNDNKPNIAFLMLNPSIADENKDDPTIRRVIRYAKDWGYGMVFILNLFAYRSTDPAQLKKTPDPVGLDNDHYINYISHNVAYIIAGWGTKGNYLNRATNVIRRLSPTHKLYCLQETKEGHPQHPLYVKSDVVPQPYGWQPNCTHRDFGVIIPQKSLDDFI